MLTRMVALLVAFAASATDVPLECPTDRAAVRSDVAPARLAFGSCSKQDKRQPLWKHIADRSPDLFTWLGDIVYADKPVLLKLRIAANGTGVRSAYAQQCTRAQHPAYAAFLRRVPVTGVWDDHDYGVNDGDESLGLEGKEEARAALLEFLAEPPLPSPSPSPSPSPHVQHGVLLTNRHALPNGGAWTSLLLGNASHAVHVLLLDNRSQRNPYADVGPVEWWKHPACSKIMQGKLLKQVRTWWQGSSRESVWGSITSTLRLLLTVLPAAAIGSGGAHNTRGCAGLHYGLYRDGAPGQRQEGSAVGPPGSGPCRQDMLGQAQWVWLQEQLATVSPLAQAVLLASGVQMLASGDLAISETWGRLPQSKARLLSLLSLYARGLLPRAGSPPGQQPPQGGAQAGEHIPPPPIFLLSGDVHFAELNALYSPALGYPLYELTSSGLTHAIGQAPSSLPSGGPAGWVASASTGLAALLTTRRGEGRFTYAGPLSGPAFASPWSADWLQQAMVQMCTLGHTRVGGWYPGRNWGEVDFHWGTGAGTGTGAGAGAAGGAGEVQVDGQQGTAAVAARGEASPLVVMEVGAGAAHRSAQAEQGEGGGDREVKLQAVTLRALGVVSATSPTSASASSSSPRLPGQRTWSEFARLVALSFGKSAWRWFGVDSRVNYQRVMGRAKARAKLEAAAQAQAKAQAEAQAEGRQQSEEGADWEGAELVQPLPVIQHVLPLALLSPHAWAQSSEQDRQAYPAPLGRAWPTPQQVGSDTVQRALAHAQQCWADPLDAGLTPACGHVLMGTWPLPAHVDYMRYHAGHAVLYSILGAAAALALLAPLWVLCLPYPKTYVVLILQLSARETDALLQPYWPGLHTARACVALLPGCQGRKKSAVPAEEGASTGSVVRAPPPPPPMPSPSPAPAARPRYVTVASLAWPYISLCVRPWAWAWAHPPAMARVLTCALLAVALAGLRAYITGLS